MFLSLNFFFLYFYKCNIFQVQKSNEISTNNNYVIFITEIRVKAAKHAKSAKFTKSAKSAKPTKPLNFQNTRKICETRKHPISIWNSWLQPLSFKIHIEIFLTLVVVTLTIGSRIISKSLIAIC